MMSTISKKSFEKSFRSFIQRVHPDKFVSQPQGVFVRNTKVVQIMNVLNGEVMAMLEHASSKFSTADLLQNIHSLLPPFSWSIYVAENADIPMKLSIADVSLSNTMDENFTIGAQLEKALSCHGAIKLDFLLFICKKVFQRSSVDSSLLSAFPNLSMQNSASRNVENIESRVTFSNIFYKVCRQQDYDVCQTLLGRLSKSSDHAWILSENIDTPSQVLARKPKFTDSAAKGPELQMVSQLRGYKRPRSHSEYRKYCDMAFQDIEFFLKQANQN